MLLVNGFPETVQIGCAQCPVVKSVAGHCNLVPDHSSVVGADGAGEADVVQCQHDLVHVKGAVAGQVGRLLKVGGRVELQVPHMSEVDSALQGADHVRKIILQVGAVGAGAEGDAVVWIVHHLHHAEDVFLVDDDTGQSKYAPGGVVGMDGHVDVIFIAHRHDALQEIFQVGEKLLVIHILVHFEELFDVGHALGLPAGQDGSVGIPADGGEHVLRVQGINCLLGIGQHSGAVRADPCKLSSGPVEHGHEIVAHHMDAGLAKVLQGGDVVVDVLVPVGGADLDGVVDVHAFDAGKLKACVLDFLFQGEDVFHLPGFAGGGSIEGGDDAGDAGDLANLFQGYGVVLAAVPA